MITREQVEDLGFVYKHELINKNKDFVNKELNTLITLSLDGKVEIIYENLKENWSNINSINEVKKIIESIKNKI
ncbi:hypothetical protein [Flavobacterium ginsenosidimutans]|uniref:hypothetical protein n=1 Tax=Flavobacterium ginsenosidimutans TaxID=687844 RepID=UPI000DAB69C8|nr:hypothetical protein [Flavobacterium ginsenosidimutans]KAF2328633.1 hypothetical protein DM444_16310 [Flavobacterium ginsenosidimutans]